jgi:hypothetical protein
MLAILTPTTRASSIAVEQKKPVQAASGHLHRLCQSLSRDA